MSVQDGFDARELEEFNSAFLENMARNYPDKTKTFLRREGRAMQKRMKAGYKTKVGKKTGNLLKGITQSPPHQYRGDWQIRVKNNAPHAHLIEYGHSNVKKRRGKARSKIPVGTPIIPIGGGAAEGGGGVQGPELFIPGRYVVSDAVREFKEQFPQDADQFVDEMLEEGLGW